MKIKQAEAETSQTSWSVRNIREESGVPGPSVTQVAPFLL